MVLPTPLSVSSREVSMSVSRGAGVAGRGTLQPCVSLTCAQGSSEPVLAVLVRFIYCSGCPSNGSPLHRKIVMWLSLAWGRGFGSLVSQLLCTFVSKVSPDSQGPKVTEASLAGMALKDYR